jgi:hypothetical protein
VSRELGAPWQHTPVCRVSDSSQQAMVVTVLITSSARYAGTYNLWMELWLEQWSIL